MPRLRLLLFFILMLLSGTFMSFSWAMGTVSPARSQCDNQLYIQRIVDFNVGRRKYTDGYVHGNVACQLEEYDTIYANSKPDQPHIPELKGVLENGFARVYSHVQNSGAYEPRKESYYKKLDQFHDIIEGVIQKELSGLNFVKIHKVLCTIVDSFNEQSDAENLNLEHIWQEVKNAIEEISHARNMHAMPFFACVIYSNPNYEKYPTFISYSTIVSQYFKNKGWLFQFEPNYSARRDPKIKKKKIGTKKFPHYQLDKNTLEFFNHDYQHLVLAILCSIPQDETQLFLKPLDLARKHFEKDTNAQVVLTNALYIMIHEGEIKFNRVIRQKKNLNIVLEDMKLLMQEQTSNKREENMYKTGFRDNEGILKTRVGKDFISLKDKNGKPLLRSNDDSNEDLLTIEGGKTKFSKLSPDEKNKAVSEAYGRFWDYASELLRQYQSTAPH